MNLFAAVHSSSGTTVMERAQRLLADRGIVAKRDRSFRLSYDSGATSAAPF